MKATNATWANSNDNIIRTQKKILRFIKKSKMLASRLQEKTKESCDTYNAENKEESKKRKRKEKWEL